MKILETILSYAPYTLITIFTPGPNNIMSLYSFSTAGWKKGREVLFAILSGYLLLLFVSMIFCHELSKYIPGLVKYLKYVGAAYILWLAVRIAKTTPGQAQTGAVNFKYAFILSVSNVKVILFLITLFTVYIIPSGAEFPEMLIHVAVLFFTNCTSLLTWGIAGGLLQKFLIKYYRPFNITMGIILIWCAVKIVC